MNNAKHAILVCAIAAALGGCYKATIHLAEGPTTPSSVQDQMHLSVIGIFELSSPIDLRATCPSGAAVIRERESFIGGLINIVLGTYIPVLQVMNPSVDCTAGGPPGAPPG